jgi:hypothetical protein
MYFQAITRGGKTIDHGVIKRREIRAAADSTAKKKPAPRKARKPA